VVLALAELESTTGFTAAELLTFNHTAVAGQQTFFLQRGLVFSTDFDQCTGDSQANGFSLTFHATAFHGNAHVVLTVVLEDSEGLLNQNLVNLRRKVIFELALINYDEAFAGGYIDPGNGSLPSAGCIGDLHARNLKLDFLGFLGRMWMLGARINKKIGEQPTSEAVTGKHTANGMFDKTGGMFLTDQGRSMLFLTTVVTRVGENHTVGLLLAGHFNLSGVDDHHIITAINMRSVSGLVLAADNLGIWLATRPRTWSLASTRTHPLREEALFK